VSTERKNKLEDNFIKLFQSISNAQSEAFHKAEKNPQRIEKKLK